MSFDGKPALSRGVVKPLACAALALTVLSQPASAATVRVDGVFYDIRFYGLGSSFASMATTGSPPIRDTPWWGNDMLAIGLANAFKEQIGVTGSPFTADSSRFTEIRFAFEENPDETPASVTYAFLREADVPIEGVEPFASSNAIDDQSSGSTGIDDDGGPNASYAYAASVTPVPLPPAGLALGAALLVLLGLRRWKGANANRTA